MACEPIIRPAEILGSELYGVLVDAAGEKPLGDSVVRQAINDATALYETELQIFLRPTRCVAEPAARGLAADAWDVEVPALDYERDMFAEERWGFVELDYRPVISVERFAFSWPGTAQPNAYVVPPTWIRLDKRRGSFRIVPTTGGGVLASFNGWVMSVLAGGRGIPQSMYVDFTTGFAEAEVRAAVENGRGSLAILIRGLRIMATLLLFPMLTNVRTGGTQSASLGMDGLSRSQSLASGEFGPYTGYIKQQLALEARCRQAWKDAEGGIDLVVL